MNRLKSLATAGVFCVPIWVIVMAAIGTDPATVVVHLEEPGVTVWLNDTSIEAADTIQSVGPLEVPAGDCRVRVIRDGRAVFERVVKVETGEQTEVWAHWLGNDLDEAAAAAAGSNGEGPVVKLDVRVKTLSSQGAAVTGVAFLGDGLSFVSSGSEGALHTWDAETGDLTGDLAAHVGPIVGVTLLADGCRAVTSGDDQRLRLWDIPRGKALSTFQPRLSSPIRTMAATPDGRLAAAATDAGGIHLVDLVTGEERHKLSVAPASPTSLSFSPDGKTLLVGVVGRSPGRVHPVVVIDAEHGREVRRLEGHRGPIWGVAYTPDGRRALSVGSDATLRVWDINTGESLHVFRNHPGAVMSVAVSPDGRYAMTGTGHRWAGGWQPADLYGVQIWDLERNRSVGRLDTDGPVNSVAFSPDGHTALAGSDDHTVRTWSLPASL